YIGEGVARGFHFEPLPTTRRDRNIEITRIRRHAFHGPFLAPEFTAYDAHTGAVIVSHVGDRAGRNVLIPWVRHFQRRRQVSPQLETVHASARIPFGHLLVQDAAARGHPLHVARGHFAFVA